MIWQKCSAKFKEFSHFVITFPSDQTPLNSIFYIEPVSKLTTRGPKWNFTTGLLWHCMDQVQNPNFHPIQMLSKFNSLATLIPCIYGYHWNSIKILCALYMVFVTFSMHYLPIFQTLRGREQWRRKFERFTEWDLCVLILNPRSGRGKKPHNSMCRHVHQGVNSIGFFDCLKLGDLVPLPPSSVCPPRASSSVPTLGQVTQL